MQSTDKPRIAIELSYDAAQTLLAFISWILSLEMFIKNNKRLIMIFGL